jgi:hypothetical protein
MKNEGALVSAELGVRAWLEKRSSVDNGSRIDYYEFLMISPTADRQMIEWAARLMLARYDPQKSKTPDEKKCQLAKEAFRTLADPKRRAAYDAELGPKQPAGGPDAKASVTRQDVIEAQQMRQAVMLMLYQAVMRKPRDPDVGRTELARQIGVATQDLEFALWFLRERDWITATQAGSYAITVIGAEWVEAGGVPQLAAPGAEGSSFHHGLSALGRGLFSGAVKQEGSPVNGRPRSLPPGTSTEPAVAAAGGGGAEASMPQQKAV